MSVEGRILSFVSDRLLKGGEKKVPGNEKRVRGTIPDNIALEEQFAHDVLVDAVDLANLC